MDVVASIQSAISIVAKLRDLSKRVEDVEFKMLLADLSSELADAKLEVANLKTELADTKAAAQKSKDENAHRVSPKPRIDSGAYVFEGDSGHFCTACFDVNQTRVLLAPLKPPFDDFGRWECPNCRNVFS